MIFEFKRFVGLITGLSLSLFILPVASADWVHLENGSKIQGDVIKQEEKWVHLRLPDGKMKIRSSRVKRIEHEEEEDYRLDQAEKKRAYGNYQQAIDEIRRVLENAPDSQKAREELRKTYLQAGQVWFQEKKIFRAQKLVERALEKFPEAEKLGSLKEEIESYEREARNILSKATELHEQGDYLKAVDRYEEVVRRLPEISEEISLQLSEVYLNAGKVQYRRKNVSEAIGHFEQAVRYDPDRMTQAKTLWLRSVMYRANRLMKQEKLTAAERFLDSQLKYFPGNKRIKFLHAYSIHLQGDVKRASKKYSAILGRQVNDDSPDISALQKKAADVSDIELRNTGSNRYENVLPGDWRTVQTEHFNISHRNQKLAKRAKKMVERYFDQIRQEVKLPELDWSQRCEIYIYPDKQTYEEEGELPGWSTGETQVDRVRGALQSHRILTYQTAPQLFQSILPHEIAHAVFYRIMNYRNTPLWLKEGVAISFEYPAKKKHYLMRIRSAYARGTLTPLKQMLGKRQYPEEEKKKNQFYAQSYSLVRFLLQKEDWPTLIEFGKALSHASPEESLDEVYGYSSIDDFEQAWFQALED